MTPEQKCEKTHTELFFSTSGWLVGMKQYCKAKDMRAK